MSSRQVVMEVPNPDGGDAKLVLESSNSNGTVQIIRRGGDVFLVTPQHEIIAALVRMDAGPRPVAQAV